MIKEKTFKVSGMHCASCELVVEKKLLELPSVQAAEASTVRGQVIIEYEGRPPDVSQLNRIFEEEKYTFAEADVKTLEGNGGGDYSPLIFVIVGLFLVMGFVVLSGLDLAERVRVDTTSSLPLFFLLGLVAGISSCAALVGGMILSMSKQWLELYSGGDSTLRKLAPHFLFNTGRILSYGVFGAVLGALGSRLAVFFGFTSFLVIAVSLLMLFLGLQMLGVGYFQGFQISMPKIFTRFVADEENFKGRQMPFLMGALTFFLPCGFTITAQGLALLSGSALQGALIMLAFVLGTTFPLLMIGFSSVKFAQSHYFSAVFPKVAGILVLFFALFNLNNQLDVLGVSSLTDLRPIKVVQDEENGLAPFVEGKHIIKMEASSRGYNPNYFMVRVGVPVRWEITDVGTTGCTNAVISRGLFEDQISLTPGQVSVKEFTPTEAGRYRFSCWMGMVSGTVEVVDPSWSVGGSVQKNNPLPTEIPSQE